MPDYLHTSAQRLERPLEDVFAFFSDPMNLERITPPWLRFEVVTPPPIEMREGTVIDYRLKIRGIPVRWQSEITLWEPPHRFVDTQRKGPYRKWVHTHSFRPIGAGTLIEDHVVYAVPGGGLVDRFLVRPDVERIFDYRKKAIEKHLAD